MSERSEIQRAVELFFEGINQNEASIIPLAEDVVMRGPMMPEQKSGEPEVRQYLSEIVPFISTATTSDTLIEGDGAAVIIGYEMLNGTIIEGAQFFRVKDGLIREAQMFYDTRVLFRGTH